MKKYPIGAIIHYRNRDDFLKKLENTKELGIHYAQVCCWATELFSDLALAREIRELLKQYDITATTFWAGWSAPCHWNFVTGPTTIGLVPPPYRCLRMQQLIAAGDFAKELGVDKVATHVGFLPENPADPDYVGTLVALQEIVRSYKEKGLTFLFETGQETPVAMLRMIEDIGLDNVGINFDTANLILYGKANPTDALDVFGKYVRDTHIKDGFYPTNGKELGKEVKVGEGKANLPSVLAKLEALGYEGTLTIEREISGEQQLTDIRDTKAYLESLMK